MAGLVYANFDLLVERATAGYRARVLESPAGEASAEFSLPFSGAELDDLLSKLERAPDGSGGASAPQRLGEQLFQALFSGEVADSLARSLDLSRQAGRGLRVRLRLNDVPELSALPWELVYDPAGARFLALSSTSPLVRYLELPQSAEELAVKPPLRVLVMLASPAGFPKLDIEAEWAELAQALRPLEQRGLVTLERLPDARLSTLQEQLRRGEYHVLHFSGHGAFDEGSGDGVLVMEDENGNGQPVSARALGDLLRDHPSLRLAVLNSCQGARSAHDDPFAGAAQGLVRAGIPAVVAMQFEIADTAAALFGHELYGSLADGYPLDAAVSEARKSLANDPGAAGVTALTWATPVLFMRSPDGTIWQVAKKKNRIRFGELEVPTLPVLALLLILASGATFMGLRATLDRPRGPLRMPGDFNVAVADFGVADTSGHIGHSDDGDRLSEWVFKSLLAQRDSYPDHDLTSNVVIWHGTQLSSEQGAPVGRVDDEAAAEKLAHDLGAQMLIWGNLDDQKQFTPHFYISSQQRGDSDLVTGHYRLGETPILVDMSAAEAVRSALTMRTNTLFWFTMGLRQENYGHGGRALAVLQEGEKYAARLKGRADGQDLYYMFLGQAALMAEGDPGTDAATADRIAENALHRALAINPELVRAQVLLGTLYFNRAQALSAADRLESTDWEQAVKEYQKAVALAAESASGGSGQAGLTSDVSTSQQTASQQTASQQTATPQSAASPSAALDRAWGPDGTPLLALGQAYKLKADAYLQTAQYADADKDYNTAIQNIEKSRLVLAAAGEERMLGQADLSLAGAFWNKAVIRRLTGGPTSEIKSLDDAARAAATECVGLGKEDQYDSVLADRVIAAGCQPLLDRLTDAAG